MFNLVYGLVSHETWTQDSTSLLFFLLGLAGLFGIGVVSALLFKGDSIKALLFVKVFLVGVGLSAFVVIVQILPNLIMPHAVGDPSDQTQQSDGYLKIVGKNGCNECDIWFFNEDKQILKKEPFLDKTETQSFEIPHGATAFGIWNAEINQNEQQLEKNAKEEYHYQFDYERSYLNDLRRGFGRYDIRPLDAKFSQVNGESERT